MKLLLPWRQPNKYQFERNVFEDHKKFFRIWMSGTGDWILIFPNGGKMLHFNNAQKAMEKCDEFLIKDGWKFITEEQAEKLRVLL